MTEKNFKIKPWKVAILSAPTPRTYMESHLYYEERLEQRFPILSPPSFLGKPKVKLRKRIRYIFEELLILANKKINGRSNGLSK